MVMNLKVIYLFQKPAWKFLFLLFYGMILSGCISHPPLVVATPTADIETVDEFFARCPTTDEVARVNSDLTLYFDYDPTVGTLVCEAANSSANLTALQKRAYQTVYVMRLLHFSHPLPWTEKPLYDWLVDVIDGIRFVKGGLSHCCEPENIIVIALNENSLILQTGQWIVNGEKRGLMNATLLYTPMKPGTMREFYIPAPPAMETTTPSIKWVPGRFNITLPYGLHNMEITVPSLLLALMPTLIAWQPCRMRK